MNKYRTYTLQMLAYALADCYETLRVGAYPLGRYPDDHPYARKLWADIDAIRDEQMARSRRAGHDYAPSWHTRSNGQPLDTEA